VRTLAGLVVFALVAACGSQTAPAPPPVAPAPPAAARAPAVPTASGPGTVKTATFHSDALGVDKQYYVYLPGGYGDDDARYPVIYMLHGLGGSEDNWPKHMGLPAAADSLNLAAIVVMPDGDDSFYVNWPTEVDYDACLNSKREFGRADDMTTYCVKAPRYEDYITVDLIAHVDATYRTIPERRARAIGGLSMGGYGALMLAMRHPDLYASVASHSGVAALLYKGPYPYENGKVELGDDPKTWLANAGVFGALFRRVFGEDLEFWRERDPAHLAAHLADGDLAIYIDCGTEDEFRLQNGAAYLHDILADRGVTHDFELLPGRHTVDFWSDRIDDSLRFHAEQFAASAAR